MSPSCSRKSWVEDAAYFTMLFGTAAIDAYADIQAKRNDPNARALRLVADVAVPLRNIGINSLNSGLCASETPFPVPALNPPGRGHLVIKKQGTFSVIDQGINDFSPYANSVQV